MNSSGVGLTPPRTPIERLPELARKLQSTYNVDQNALRQFLFQSALDEGEQKDQRFYWVTFDSYQVNGSGSTGCAAVLEGFRYLGCELEAEYVEIARRRIAYWQTQRAEPDLFG